MLTHSSGPKKDGDIRSLEILGFKMCLKSPGTPLKASSTHICPRTFETDLTIIMVWVNVTIVSSFAKENTQSHIMTHPSSRTYSDAHRLRRREERGAGAVDGAPARQRLRHLQGHRRRISVSIYRTKPVKWYSVVL